MTIVIQCPSCSQKYRVVPEQLGTSVQCQKCQHPFVAFELEAAPVSAIPPEFDDSMPVTRSKSADSGVNDEHENERRETQHRMAQRLAALEVKQATSGMPGRGGRVLFWGGAAMVLIGILLSTAVAGGGSERVHNLSRAANQLLLVVIGIASMICGASIISQSEELSSLERLGVVIWMVLVTFVLAVPMLKS